jgi:hypothetical protein
MEMVALARAMQELDSSVIRGAGLWGQARGALATSALKLAPTIATTCIDSRSVAPRFLMQMIRTDALRQTTYVPRQDELLVIDEGAVFALAWMDVFFPRWNWPQGDEWRGRTIEWWAHRLNAVVRLDADDATLVRRIRSRSKKHAVKQLPDSGIRRFTDSFRIAFDNVLDELLAVRDVPVIELGTDVSRSEAVAFVSSSLRECANA